MVKDTTETHCHNNTCREKGKNLCSGCNEAIYCSRDCQKSHWLMHKEACQAATKLKKITDFETLSAKQLKILLKVKAASLEKNKKNALLDLLEKTVEKGELVSLVKVHVQLSEVASLLSVPEGKSSSGSSSRYIFIYMYMYVYICIFVYIHIYIYV
jgi:hypothetical protein